MKRDRRRESGQTIVEFALIALVLLMLTMGLVDAGRAFYQYNTLADAARFGARWGSVVGGACILAMANTTDWCTEEGVITNGNNFWQQSGNKAIQGSGVACPSFSSTPADYYKVSDPDNDGDNDFSGDTDSDSTKVTTIVGAIGRHFDTSSTTTHTTQGGLAGIDLNNLRVCIQTTDSNTVQTRGDYVTVVLYYRFNPITPILSKASFDLVAQSSYEVEG
jgi:hypothetical protein